MSSNTNYGYSSEYDALTDAYDVRQNALSADRAPSSRTDLMQMTQTSNGGSALWDGVGYPAEGSLDFGDYWLRYERQGFARGLIDKPADATWQETPDLVEADEGESETDFEQEVAELLAGDHTRRKPVHRFHVADRLATLGEYAILVFGFADGRDLSTPVRGVGENEDPEFDGLDDLEYLAVFGQDRIERVDTVSDMSNSRYRLPETYEVVVEDQQSDDADAQTEDEASRTQTIHWSRAIHIPEGTLEDDLRGTPALKPVWNNLLNVEKILAGSAEGYWRGGYQGIVVRPPEGPDGLPAQFDDGSEGLAEEIRAWEQNYKRMIATTGRVETLDTSLDSPEDHLNQQIKEISACKDTPQSVLMGNETGERATTEDNAMWREKIASRRTNFGDSRILSPWAQRLIDVGVLTPPQSGGFLADWPALSELSESDEATIAKTTADALTALEGLNEGDYPLATPGELRSVLGWGEEVGSETDEDPEEVFGNEDDAAEADETPGDVDTDAFAEEAGDDSTLPDQPPADDADAVGDGGDNNEDD